MNNEEIHKLDMRSKDIVEDNISKISELFPDCISEGKIDFNKLKQELSKDIIEDGKERYQLTWVGKKEAIINANIPCNKTLRPVKEKSVDFDNTKNIYIEGDNLEVLKILQESYLNKIKCIYIDPPYNTGNDFIYNDKFVNGNELEESGQIDEYDNKLVSNQESNGKFHSNWLAMMYSRLKISRNLLRDDGYIFISIDDNEVADLKIICDEIYGENNFVTILTIESGEVFGTKAAHVSKTFVKVKDYILIYKKNKDKDTKEKCPLVDEMRELFDTHYKTVIDEKMCTYNLIEYLKSNYSISDKFLRYNLKLTNDNINTLMQIDNDFKKYMYNEIAPKLYADAPYSKKIDESILEKYEKNKVFLYDNKLLFKTATGSIRMYIKFSDCLKQSDNYMSNYTRCTYRGDLWKGFHFDMRNIDDEGNIKFKNGKKPVRLIEQLIKWLNDDEYYVLDFFSGSATTAHACLKYNNEYSKKIKFIMVQLPERLIEDGVKDNETICDLGEKRIKNVGKKIKNANLDIGFRVYKMDSSNMKDVYYTPTDIKQSQLNMFESNIKEDRTSEDLLTQVILDLGLTLDLSIEERKIFNNNVYFVENNSLVACFDDTIDINIIDEICKCNPLKIVFKESSFKTDSDKINTFERIKKLSNDTEINII